jgi:two-component system, OmpR family, response regulator
MSGSSGAALTVVEAPVIEAPPWRSMAAAPRRGRGLGVTVLLVEDEHNIGALVRTYLEREGHSVVWARSGEEALAELTRHPVRMVVLDIGLPGIDGFEVLRRVRASSSVPVIMLTARDEEADRVVGLELGADDYVPKPFSPRELVARVKAVLRRTEGEAKREVLFLGDVAVDLTARASSVAGVPVALTLKEFDLLACFLEHPGVVLSRERLLELVWDLEFPGGTRTVDQHVAQLRAKLGGAVTIETVRGIGYKAVRS